MTSRTIAALTRTVRALRSRPDKRADRGSHTVEYALGIGLGAAAILAVFAAYRIGLANIIATWVFSLTG
jgi:hypothetical protein